MQVTFQGQNNPTQFGISPAGVPRRPDTMRIVSKFGVQILPATRIPVFAATGQKLNHFA